MAVDAADDTLKPMLADARALAPVLRDRAQETDDLRRLPDETVADIDDLGILGVGAPRGVGGADLGPDAIFLLTFELARGCGSTAWCAGNWAIHNVLAAAFPKEAQDEWFDGARMPRVATGFSPLRAKATPASGGTVLEGTWDFSSGVDHSQWVALVAIVEQGPSVFMVPRDELQLVDTWHTSGLRGTGSKDVVAKSVFVPAHRAVSMAALSEGRTPGRELHDTPSLRVSLASIFAPGVIGTILGVVAGAYDEFVRRTSEKLGGITGVKVGDRTDVHLRMGLAASNLEAAVLMVRSTFADVRTAADTGSYTIADRVRWRCSVAWAAKLATESMTLLFKAGGAHVLFLDDSLNRAHRDLTAAAQHYGMQWDGLFIDQARVALGMDATTLML